MSTHRYVLDCVLGHSPSLCGKLSRRDYVHDDLFMYVVP